MENSMYRKVLVTGGSGLLGRAFQTIGTELPEREFIFVDTKDCDLTAIDQVVQLFADHRPDAVMHLAAVSGGVRLSLDYPATLLRDNVYMNLNVLEAARCNGIVKTVMALSSGMYPENAPIPIKEEYIHQGLPHVSNCSYAFAKRLIEPSVKAYRAEYGMNVIGVVPNGIFGEYGNFSYEEAAMWAALIRRFYENREGDGDLVIWGDGTPLREHTYAPDMARAFLWCLDNYDDPEIINVGSVEEYSVRDIALMIAEILDINAQRLVFDTSKPAGVQRKSTDNSKFIRLSGFTYTPFRTGLERTIRWFIDNCEIAGKVRFKGYL